MKLGMNQTAHPNGFGPKSLTENCAVLTVSCHVNILLSPFNRFFDYRALHLNRRRDNFN